MSKSPNQKHTLQFTATGSLLRALILANIQGSYVDAKPPRLYAGTATLCRQVRVLLFLIPLLVLLQPVDPVCPRFYRHPKGPYGPERTPLLHRRDHCVSAAASP